MLKPAEKVNLPHIHQKSDRSSLETLRELLLVDELKRLEQLEKKINNRQQQLDQITELLPESIQQNYQKNKTHLLHYLSPPIKSTLNQWVKDNPQEISNTLFPIMGEAIRKSIKKALTDMQANIELALEHSFSPKVLKWRIQAWKTGRSFSELLLLNSLDYQIEQVFLFQSETGLLISHVQSEKAIIKDPKMISGMLTAIKDFILDSFAANENNLSELRLGDLFVRLYGSPHATLAAIIRGNPPAEIDELIQQNVEQIHAYYASSLKNYDGQGSLKQTTPYLKNCLVSRLKKENKKTDEKKKSWLAWLLPLMILSSMGVLFYQNHQKENQWQILLKQIENEAGWALKAVDKEAKTVTIFNDPLSRSVTAFKRQKIFANELTWQTTAFLSLDDSILEKRIQQSMNLPQTVQIKVQDHHLFLSGSASKSWFEQQNVKQFNFFGISQINTDHLQLLVDKNKNLKQIIQLLSPPKTVKVQVENNILKISGLAKQVWIKQLNRLKMNHFDLVDTRDLINLNFEYTKIKQQIEQITFYFEPDSINLKQQNEKILQASQKIHSLLNLSAYLNLNIQIGILGKTDLTGNKINNQKLAIARSKIVYFALLKTGLKAKYVTFINFEKMKIFKQQNNFPLLSQRRVELHVIEHQ